VPRAILPSGTELRITHRADALTAAAGSWRTLP